MYALETWSAEVTLPEGVETPGDLTSQKASAMFEDLAHSMMEDQRRKAKPLEPWDVYNLLMDHSIGVSDSLRMSTNQMWDLKHQLKPPSIAAVSPAPAADLAILRAYITISDDSEPAPAAPITPAKSKSSKAATKASTSSNATNA